jgi:hypothetical protein
MALVAKVLSLSPLALVLAVAADADITALFGANAAVGVVIAITVAWTVLGAVLVWRTTSTMARSMTLLLFTIPATVVAVTGPWLALGAVRP